MAKKLLGEAKGKFYIRWQIKKKSFISGFSLHHCLFLRTLEKLRSEAEKIKVQKTLFNPLQRFPDICLSASFQTNNEICQS
jgi:hypothetical protein